MKNSLFIFACIAVLSFAIGCDETIADRCVFQSDNVPTNKLQYFNGNTCVCQDVSRVINENGECVCGDGKIEAKDQTGKETGECVCEDITRQINNKGECVCGSDKHEEDGNCICNDSYQKVNSNGQCECSNPNQRVGDSGICECTEPMKIINEDGQCVCVENSYLNDEQQCACKTGYIYQDNSNKCVFANDVNGNHLLDKYEMENMDLNKPCRKHSDCSSKFCDSFIGYTCSTKCTSDSQCIGSALTDGFNYVCRPDGRCAPDSFNTQWKIPDKEGKDSTIAFYVTKFDEISIDWGDDKKYSYACEGENDIFCNANLIEKNNNDSEWKEFDSRDDTLSVGTRRKGEDKLIKIQHQYKNPGTYSVKISGSGIENIGLNIDDNDGTRQNFLGVLSYGPVQISSKFFAKTEKLIFVSEVDIPDATLLTTMEYMFFNASSFNCDISNWDVSNVNSMSHTFENAKSFNQNISHWDVSKVTTFHKMLNQASEFNQNIIDLNISNGANVASMLHGTKLCLNTLFNPYIQKWGENVCKLINYK